MIGCSHSHLLLFYSLSTSALTHRSDPKIVALFVPGDSDLEDAELFQTFLHEPETSSKRGFFNLHNAFTCQALCLSSRQRPHLEINWSSLQCANKGLDWFYLRRKRPRRSWNLWQFAFCYLIPCLCVQDPKDKCIFI